MAISFIKVTDTLPVVRHLVAAIERRLSEQLPVLWLLSGGSVIPIESAVAQDIVAKSWNTSLITVSLADERPGPVGHPASNWQGLLDAGFNLPGGKLRPVLTGGSTQGDTFAHNQFIDNQLNSPSYKLALLGIGPDGHTAGMPHAGTLESNVLVEHYSVPGFERISITPRAFPLLDEVVVYSAGPAKESALEQFKLNLPVARQSAQAIKLARAATVYSDLMGESQ